MSSSSFNPATSIGDLSGKVILVTGASSGLGKETVLQLAKHSPAKIYLGARSESKAHDAISSIKSEVRTPTELIWLPLDTSSFDSVKKAADTFNQENTRLDTLILNAGIMATPAETAPSGHDLQLATNHMGHFLLTKKLLPTLLSTATQPSSDVRIVSISSSAQQMSPSVDVITSIKELNAKSPWTRYGATKAANVLFAAELARRHPEVTSVSLHPGVIKTNLWKHDEQSNSMIHYFMLLFGRFRYSTLEQGAYNQLWAGFGAKKGELKNGAYYMPVGKSQPGNKYTKDLAGAKKLWDWTESELSKSGF